MYRIYTEDRNRSAILGLCSDTFDSFTVIPAIGYWQGKPEQSLVIEAETEDEIAVQKLAVAIRRANQQDAVLVSKVESKVTLIRC